MVAPAWRGSLQPCYQAPGGGLLLCISQVQWLLKLKSGGPTLAFRTALTLVSSIGCPGHAYCSPGGSSPPFCCASGTVSGSATDCEVVIGLAGSRHSPLHGERGLVSAQATGQDSAEQGVAGAWASRSQRPRPELLASRPTHCRGYVGRERPKQPNTLGWLAGLSTGTGTAIAAAGDT